MFDKTELDDLYRYALALSQDNESAYDLLYSNIEKLLSSGRDIDKINNKKAYMKRSIRNSYFDTQRQNNMRLVKNSLIQNDYQALQDEMDSLEEVMINQQSCDHLLNALPQDDREVLFLWAVEGYTAQEIADCQGGPRSTWLSKIHRIKQRLRKQFSPSSIGNREVINENI